MKRLLVASILLLTACSIESDPDAARSSAGGTAAPPGAASANSPSEADIAVAAQATEKLLELSDGDAVEPSVALLVAADRGYAASAIFDAVADDRFLLDGIIVDERGRHVRPSGDDTGLITNKQPLQGLRRTGPASITTFGLSDQLLLELQMIDLENLPPTPAPATGLLAQADPEARSAYLLIRIAELLRQGRGVDDIITAIVNGDVDRCLDSSDADVGFCDPADDDTAEQPSPGQEASSEQPPAAEPAAPAAPTETAPPAAPAIDLITAEFTGSLGYRIWLDTGEPDVVTSDDALLTVEGGNVTLFFFQMSYNLVDSLDPTCAGSGTYSIVSTGPPSAINAGFPVVLDYQGTATGCLSPEGGVYSTTGTGSVTITGGAAFVNIQLDGPGWEEAVLPFALVQT